MAIDSMTDEVIAVFEDKQHAGFTERFRSGALLKKLSSSGRKKRENSWMKRIT